MTRKQRRLVLIGSGIAVLAVAVALMLNALRGSIVFFNSPSGLYFKPQVLLIWLGAAIMFAGGALSLSDRRLRVGAPQPAKARAVLQPAE